MRLVLFVFDFGFYFFGGLNCLFWLFLVEDSWIVVDLVWVCLLVLCLVYCLFGECVRIRSFYEIVLFYDLFVVVCYFV